MDAAVPGLLVAQAIGRIGNYFNQELFGGPTNLPWGLQIDPAHRPAGYAHYATFHPTFLYELIWNLGLAGRAGVARPSSPDPAAGIVRAVRRRLLGVSDLRGAAAVDPAHHILGLRLNFFVASLLFLAGVAWFVRIQRGALPWRRGRRPAALVLAGTGARFRAAATHPEQVRSLAQPSIRGSPYPVQARFSRAASRTPEGALA